MNQRRSLRSSAPLQAGLVAVLLLGCEAAPTVGGDYLSPDLRAKVEQLKVDRAAAPTSPANVYERVDILWEWANAYALTGGPLPVNFALDTAIMRWAEADGSPPDERLVADVELNTVEDYVPYIDRYLEELQIKDEDPGALGSLRVVPDEPLTAGTKATVELVYEVGNMPMQIGGGVLAGRQWLADVNDFQNQDPAGPNYLTARTSRPDARLEAVMVPLVGPHGSQRFPKPTPAFRLVGAPLEPGDTITVTYGDRSGGSEGIRVQAFETDALLLPLYIDPQGNGNWLTPEWPSLTVIGGAVAGVRLLAPSVVAVGETFDLTVRSEDGAFNRASGALPGYEILLNGEVVAEVAEPESAVAIAGGLTIQEPGTYRFVVRSTDDTLEATSNPVWVEAEPQRRILWGETHGHTGFAEGQGSPAGYFRYGVEDARLDFLTLSEHDFWLDDYEWQQLQEISRRTTESGRAIAFLGYEWTPTRKRGGHHNVLFRSPDRERVPVQEANRLPLLWEGLRGANDPADVLVIPHAHSAGDWTQSDGELERVVEIYSEHGTFEWYGNMFLRNGFEVGFLAASDDHRAKPGAPQGHFQASLIGVPGLAAVRAGEKDRRRHLRRPARALGLRRLRTAHPSRRRAERPSDGGPPAAGRTAPHRGPGIRHLPHRPHGGDQERRSRLQPQLPVGAAWRQVLASTRLRVLLGGLHAGRGRQPTPLPRLARGAACAGRAGPGRRSCRPRQPGARLDRDRRRRRVSLRHSHPRPQRHRSVGHRRRHGVDHT